MSSTNKHTVKNIFKITFLVITVNVCALTTQYFVDNHHNSDMASLSISEYTHTLIKGKLLPTVLTITNHFID